MIFFFGGRGGGSKPLDSDPFSWLKIRFYCVLVLLEDQKPLSRLNMEEFIKESSNNQVMCTHSDQF